MSKHRVAVLKVVSSQSSVTAAAAEYGLSRGHLHRLLRRYREGGLDDLEPRSRRPRTSPHRTADAARDRIVALRTELTAGGPDAGPATIAWHLEREGLPVPSTSTIRRILHAAGLVVPEPRKRPRSSWIRFEAAAPNEVWQSDFTHWRLRYQARALDRYRLALRSPAGVYGVRIQEVLGPADEKVDPRCRYQRRTRAAWLDARYSEFVSTGTLELIVDGPGTKYDGDRYRDAKTISVEDKLPRVFARSRSTGCRPSGGIRSASGRLRSVAVGGRQRWPRLGIATTSRSDGTRSCNAQGTGVQSPGTVSSWPRRGAPWMGVKVQREPASWPILTSQNAGSTTWTRSVTSN